MSEFCESIAEILEQAYFFNIPATEAPSLSGKLARDLKRPDSLSHHR
jgi:hypothetical protein